MLKNHSKSKSGFTIIEVVLVLAIAGLIFLMVFLALPALQRSQRDTQRRDDLSGFSTQITNYQSNNRGKVPSSTDISTKWKNFLLDYMKQGPKDKAKSISPNSPEWSDVMNEGEFVDPDGSAYRLNVEAGNAYSIPADRDFQNEEERHIIHLVYGAKCDGEEAVPATGGSSRQLAFLYKMEGGGVYCGSNS